MSEKHLTELAWKTLATKQKLKDPGLGKALAELAKCDDTDPERALKALAAVEKHAEALKKEFPKNEEVKEHLTELLKESDKRCKTLELLKKGAEAEETEDEEGGDLKSMLIGGLKKVKQRKPDDSPVEVLVCKGKAGFATLLATKVGAKHKGQLQELFKGENLKFIKGTCELGEKEVYTFVLESLPTGAAKGLKLFLKEQTGNSYKIQVKDTSGAVESDLAEGLQGDPLAEFTRRFQGLLPRIKQAIAAGGTTSQEIKLKSSEAGVMANKKDFARANQLLDETELLLSKGGATGKSAPQSADVLKIWQQAKDTADAQLGVLYAKLNASGIPQVIAAANGIEAVMGNYRTKMVTALTAYNTASGSAKEKARADALKVVAAYQAGIPKDKHIIAADTNPFQVKVSVGEILGDALMNLSKSLQAT